MEVRHDGDCYRREVRAGVVVIVGAVAVATSAAADPPKPTRTSMPHPRPARAPGYDVAGVNASCERCHADIASEWRASLHRASATDPVYQRAHAREPLAFCASCHAPEGDARAAIGVACVTCHVPDAAVLAVPTAPSNGTHVAAPRAAPHAVMRDARFATPEACAACHEFRFPTAPSDSAWPSDFMQSTVHEHARSRSAATSCASCHMPRVADARGGHASHAFAASRDETSVRAAVTVAASRPSRARVRIVLTPRAVGHAFPTGDLFRRLAVSAEARDARGQLRVRDEAFLARHAPQQPRAPGLPKDDRVAIDGSSSTVWLDVAGAADGDTIAWRVVYQRVEHLTSTNDRDAVVEGEIVVASGTLEPR